MPSTAVAQPSLKLDAVDMKNIKYICFSVMAAGWLTWSQYYPLLDIFSLISLIGYFLALIISALGVTSRANLKQRAVFLCIISSWYYALRINNQNDLSHLIQIKMGVQKYATCETSGIKINGGRLSVCDVNSKWWRYGFTDSIVYDSSGQITLKHNLRSQDWIRAALKLPPFGIIGFDATRLTGDFYLVTFYDDEEDVLRNDLTPEDRCKSD